MFRSERVLRIICFEPVFLAFNPGSCPQSHTGQGFSSCVFSCQRAKKSIVLGHFPFHFELWFFLIWSWSIPVGASKIRCSTRIFAVSKTAATDHGRHESTKCEQDSKSGVPATVPWVRIPPAAPTSRQHHKVISRRERCEIDRRCCFSFTNPEYTLIKPWNISKMCYTIYIYCNIVFL